MARRTVMIIDDDGDLCTALSTALTGEGWPVVCARNGTEFLEHLRGPTPLPGVILVDLKMSMSMSMTTGGEFAAATMPGGRLADIPVVAMTTPHATALPREV